MKNTAYHCTNNLEGIKVDGLVKPSRLINVFLFKLEETARCYLKEFDYKNIVVVEYDSKDIESTWKPRWASGETVIKLKPEKTAKFVNEVEVSNA